VNLNNTSARSFRLPLSAYLILACVTLSYFCQSSCAQNPVKLRYGWTQGQEHGFKFSAEFGDENKEKVNGFATYSLEKVDVQKDLSGKNLESFDGGEATSTAFAVTNDGYLLTCAHCVRGAEVIEVFLGKKSYQAKVIESDADLDLALLKIDATDIPCVTLSKTAKVELAQDIRAIGFPLSDVLGNSVKVTRGSIAGFVEEFETQSYQIDAAVNPGNSGGPLVDETGTVIGVVNAKLNGAQISKVGFAVPIKHACDMLERHQVNYKEDVQTKVLSGVELAKKVAPAVLFVKATIGEGVANSNYQFSISGSLNHSGERGYEIVQSRAIVGLDGVLLDSKEPVNFPMMLGPVCGLPFEMLPNRPQESWTLAQRILIPLPSSAPKQTSRRAPFGFGGFGPGFGPRFGGFGRQSVETEEPETRIAVATRIAKYKVKSRDKNLVTIDCDVRLKTEDDENEFSRLRIENKSTLTFDTKLGVFVKKQLKGKLDLKIGDERIQLPIKFSYQRVNLEERDGQLETAGKPATQQELNWPARLVDQELDEVNNRELLAILDGLNSATVEETHQKAVVKRLENVIANRDNVLRKPAILAMLRWDRSAATPWVIREYKTANPFSKRSWLKRLGQTGSPEAAKLLCEQLGDLTIQNDIKSALMEIGVVGEPALLAKLESNLDKTELSLVCLDLIGRIGTEKSIETLKFLAQKRPPAGERNNESLSARLDSALNRIHARLKTK
jgi:hypothetical protein